MTPLVPRAFTPIDHRGRQRRDAGSPGAIGAMMGDAVKSIDPASRHGYDAMLRRRGRELASIVASIAEAPDPGLVLSPHSEDESRVIIALTLLAAGLPLDLVASPETPLRRALDLVDEFHGIEFYLLSNGLGVEHFHALRERLDSSAAMYRGDVA